MIEEITDTVPTSGAVSPHSDKIQASTELKVLASTEQQIDNDQDATEEYPEGGRQAWLVVFGSWCAMTACMGLLNAMGALHAWISDHQLEEYSASQVGWIFSVFTFFLYFGGAQNGMFLSRSLLA